MRPVARFLLLTVLALAGPVRAQPAPAQTAEATTPAPEPSGSIAEMRREYEKIREAIFSSRARAAAVGNALFSSRVALQLRWASGRLQHVRRATIRLDGAVVFDDESGAIAANDAPRFDGFVAPGIHTVSVRIEAEGKDDARFVSTIEDTFSVDVPTASLLLLRMRAEDAGDIAWSFAKKKRGAYRLRLDAEVEMTALPPAPQPTAAKAAGAR